MGFFGKALTAQVLLLIVAFYIDNSSGHGMVLDPVNRASRWKYDKTAVPDYDDMGLFCGGFDVICHKLENIIFFIKER